MSLFGKKNDGSSGLVGNSSGGGGLENLQIWSQNQWDNLTGKNAREAQKQAAKEAERVRRENITREMGAKNQADSMAFAGLMRPSNSNSGGGSNNQPGIVGQSADAPGTIGANLNISGTF